MVVCTLCRYESRWHNKLIAAQKTRIQAAVISPDVTTAPLRANLPPSSPTYRHAVTCVCACVWHRIHGGHVAAHTCSTWKVWWCLLRFDCRNRVIVFGRCSVDSIASLHDADDSDVPLSRMSSRLSLFRGMGVIVWDDNRICWVFLTTNLFSNSARHTFTMALLRQLIQPETKQLRGQLRPRPSQYGEKRHACFCFALCLY